MRLQYTMQTLPTLSTTGTGSLCPPSFWGIHFLPVHQRQKWHPPYLRPDVHIRLPRPTHPRGKAIAVSAQYARISSGRGGIFFAPCAIISIPNGRLLSPAPLGESFYAIQTLPVFCQRRCRPLDSGEKRLLPLLHRERNFFCPCVSSGISGFYAQPIRAAQPLRFLRNTPVFLPGKGVGDRSAARPLPDRNARLPAPDFSAFHERPAGTESSRRGAMRVTACEPSAPAPYPRRYSPFPSADRGCGRFPSSSFLFSPARGLPPARPLRRCFPLPSA